MIAILQSSCQNEPVVPGQSQFDDFLDRREHDLLAEHPDRATRVGNLLDLRLGDDPTASGRVKTFEDMPASEGYENCRFYRLFEIDRANRTAVIFERYWEGHAAQLIDFRSGKSIDLEDVPHVSPTGNFWVIADYDIGYGNGRIQIVTRHENGFAITADAFEHGYCSFAAWTEDNTAQLYCPVTSDAGVDFDDIRETFIARKADGSWSERETGRKVSYDEYLAP